MKSDFEFRINSSFMRAMLILRRHNWSIERDDFMNEMQKYRLGPQKIKQPPYIVFSHTLPFNSYRIVTDRSFSPYSYKSGTKFYVQPEILSKFFISGAEDFTRGFLMMADDQFEETIRRAIILNLSNSVNSFYKYLNETCTMIGMLKHTSTVKTSQSYYVWSSTLKQILASSKTRIALAQGELKQVMEAYELLPEFLPLMQRDLSTEAVLILTAIKENYFMSDENNVLDGLDDTHMADDIKTGVRSLYKLTSDVMLKLCCDIFSFFSSKLDDENREEFQDVNDLLVVFKLSN